MTAPNTALGLVEPEVWRSRTALRLSRRSPTLLAIDTAYAAYFAPGGRTQANAIGLYTLLEQYLVAHHGRWSQADRNVASGGLMEAVHNIAAQHAGVPALAATHPRHVVEAQAAHARLGVLYLFANTEVSTQFAAIFIEGAMGVVSKAGELIPEAGAFTAYGQDLHATQVVAPGASGIGAITGVVQHLNASTAVTPQAPAPRAPVVIHRRRGAIVQGMPRAPIAPPPPRPAPSPHWAPVGVLLDAGSAMYDAGAWAARLGAEFMQYLWRKINEFVDWTISKIQTNERTVWQVTGQVITQLVKAAVAHIAKACVPLVGGLMEVGKGIMEVISAAKARIEAALLRRHFDVQAGHPQALAASIESAMNWAIGKGLWTSLRGAASASLSVLSAGASTIGEVVASALEFIAKTILRIRESMKMTAVLTVAKLKYAECRVPSTNAESTSVQPKPGSLVTKTDEFTHLYETWCDASPCIPMLTLNSGVCGDLMQMMKMFDDTSTAAIVSHEAFHAGAEYFTQLKQFGRKYLKDSGFQFNSANITVRGLLNHALNHHNEGSLSRTDAALTLLGG